MEKIIEEKFVTNSRAKKILKKRFKEIELGYEQKNALDHLKKFDKLTSKKAKELVKSLLEVKKLRRKEIIKIVNLMPQDKDDLRTTLEKDYNNLTEDEKKLILNSVKKFI